MSTSTLTQFQRGQLGQLVSEGSTYQVMADALGVAKSTIHYELQRNTPYNAGLAQLDADAKRKACGRHSILTPDKQRLIENHLRLTWSPEMIPSMFDFATASIYHWLSTGQLNFDLTNLQNRNIYQKRSKEKRGTFVTGKSIEQRPIDVNNRYDFGHWEIDTVLSGRGDSKACLVTFVERKSRLLWALKVANRTSEALNTAFDSFMEVFGSQAKSITVDHGKEFSNYQVLEAKYNVTVYFCHAYSPWEHGSNEYFNRRLRWFFPKRTNFNQITEDTLLESLDLINNRPLKINQLQTAIEKFRACSD